MRAEFSVLSTIFVMDFGGPRVSGERPFASRHRPGSLGMVLSHFVAPYAVAILIAALWVRWSALPSLFRHGSAMSNGVWVILGIILGLACVGAGVALEERAWYRAMASQLQRTVRAALGPKVSVIDALLIALSSSLGEEALFRGALQSWLLKATPTLVSSEPLSIGVALFLTALLFGLMHAPLVPELRPWTILALVMGLVFGLVSWLAEGLLPAIAAHATINFINLLRMNSARYD